MSFARWCREDGALQAVDRVMAQASTSRNDGAPQAANGARVASVDGATAQARVGCAWSLVVATAA